MRRRRAPLPEPEGGALQAHLTQRDEYGGKELMEAMNLIIAYDMIIKQATQGNERPGDEGKVVIPSDPFRDEAVRCLGTEIGCEEWLEPKSWATAKPHIEVVTSIGRDHVLKVCVRPWKEFKDGKSGQKIDGRSDFGRLRDGSKAGQIEAMRFDLACLGEPRVVKDKEEGRKALTMQRAAVAKLYERCVSDLSRRFVCRVASGLVCFGEGNELTVRESRLDNEIEVANLLSDSASDWHPTLPKLCQRLGIRSDEALALFRNRLTQAQLEQQARTLLEFSGRKLYGPESLKIPTQLAQALGAVCATQGRVVLSAGNEVAAREELERLERTEGALWEELLNRYGLDEDDAWTVIRGAHPQLYKRLGRTAKRWREEIDAVARGDYAAWETQAEMARRMMEQLKVEAKAAARQWHVQLRRVSATMGLERESLRKWGQEHAPAVAEWVEEMVETKGGTIKRRKQEAQRT